MLPNLHSWLMITKVITLNLNHLYRMSLKHVSPAKVFKPVQNFQFYNESLFYCKKSDEDRL